MISALFTKQRINRWAHVAAGWKAGSRPIVVESINFAVYYFDRLNSTDWK
jgi:hypothetical protein